MFTVIENLSDHEDVVPAEGELAESGPPMKEGSLPDGANDIRGEGSILCVGAQGSLDDVAAAIMAQLLRRRGIGARSLASHDVSPDSLPRLDMKGVSVAILSYMSEDAIPHAKYLIRRLRRRTPAIKVIAGFWSMTADQLVQRNVMDETRADLVTASLKDALDQVTILATSQTAGRQVGKEGT
jgi:hypothetical protein